MQVREVMSHPVDYIPPTMTSCDAAQRMRDDHVGALPVAENDRLIGMVTDRDIVVRGVAEDKSPGNTAVSAVMSKGIYYCYDDNSLEEAAQIMAEHQVRRLPVLNREKRLVGIIALADLARSGEKQAEERALEGVSRPSLQPRR